METEVNRDGNAKMFTNKDSRDDNKYKVHPYIFLETLLLERYGVGGAPCMLLPIFPSLKVRKKA